MQRICRIFTVALAGLLLIAVPPALGEEGKETTCEGKYKGGKKPTREEITKILEDHRTWVKSKKKGGRRANLCEADLRGADLSKAKLWGADLSKANLREANLSEAKLWRANLSKAVLLEADLSKAKLWGG